MDCTIKYDSGGYVRDGVGSKETSGRLHLFAFTPGNSKEEVNHDNREGNNLVITLTVNA